MTFWGTLKHSKKHVFDQKKYFFGYFWVFSIGLRGFSWKNTPPWISTATLKEYCLWIVGVWTNQSLLLSVLGSRHQLSTGCLDLVLVYLRNHKTISQKCWGLETFFKTLFFLNINRIHKSFIKSLNHSSQIVCNYLSIVLKIIVSCIFTVPLQ